MNQKTQNDFLYNSMNNHTNFKGLSLWHREELHLSVSTLMVGLFPSSGLPWIWCTCPFSLDTCRQGNCKLTYRLLISSCLLPSRVTMATVQTSLEVLMPTNCSCTISHPTKSTPSRTLLPRPCLCPLWSAPDPSPSLLSNTLRHPMTMVVQSDHLR